MAMGSQSSDDATAAPVDLTKLVKTVLKDSVVARHGLQGVHAEVMRRMASTGSGAFVDYAAVRAIYERLVKARKLPVAAE
jgi:hypothetical protein